MALVLAVGAVVFFAPAGTAQDDDDDDSIPVDFTPTRIGSVNLYLWEEDYDQGSSACEVQPDDDEGEGNSYTPFCSARLDVPTSSTADRQTQNVVQESVIVPQDADSMARFVMDTEPERALGPLSADSGDHHVDEAIRGQGAEFPFTIRAGSNAIVYDFHYNANQQCTNLVGQDLEFTMQLRRAQAPSAPLEGVEEGDVISRSIATTESCGHSGTMTQTGSQRVTVGVDLDNPIHVDAGETLIVEIFAEAPSIAQSGGDLNWMILYGAEEYDSSVRLSTNQVVEKALWTTDHTNTFQSIFDPFAPDDERVMAGHIALRSAFGAGAFETEDGIQGTIENPEGTLMNLHPASDEDRFSVTYEPIDGWSSNNDALQVYRFPHIDGEPVWSYDPDQANFQEGPHTLTASGFLVGAQERAIDAGTTVAMGDFGFSLETVPGENDRHEMMPGSSSTFLLQLTNEAPTTETFELDTEFRFSEGGAPWSVNLRGVDANDRVTLNEGETALIRVTITPPSQATIGDAARVALNAESLTADSTETKTLEATITDRTTRDVDVLVVREDPYHVGVDRTTQINVFLWNRGTATDELRASFVDESFDPDDSDVFDASFPQRTFPNVAPGDVTRLPIDVTTTNLVEAGQELSFDVQAHSTENTDARGQETVTVLVDSVRDLSATALLGTNDKATISERFGKFNISGAPTGASDTCEDPDGWNPSAQYQRNCADFTNHTYHIFQVENRGDLAEDIRIEEVGGTFGASSSCTNILSDRFEGTAFVSSIDWDNPGSEEAMDSEFTLAPGEMTRFFLRVSYDGESNYWDDVNPNQPFVSQCDWENYKNNVRVGIPGTTESTLIGTETRVYSLHPGEDHGGTHDQMSPTASANLALQDLTMRNETLVSLPTHLPVNPDLVSEEDPAVLPFSVSLQSGHYDPAKISVIGNTDGWDIEIVPRNAQALPLDDGELLYPARFAYDDPDEPRYGPEAFHEVSGGHLEAELHIKSIPEGLQEDHRETFTILAESSQDSSVRDTLSVGIQVGEEFAFDVDPGVVELEAEQGGEVAFALEIFNTGATRDTYTIEATATPGVYDDPIVREQTVGITGGTSKTVSLHLDIPSGADAPANIDVDITADHGSPTEEPFPTQSVTYAVDVVPQGTLSLEGPDEPVRIGPGGEASLGFTIVNDANTDQEVEMSELVAPLGFETTLTDTNATVTVEADSSETFTYLIEAPEDILEGSTFPFTLKATDEEGNIATSVGHASVIGETAVRLVAEDDEQVIERGSNITFPVRVENPGNAPAEYDIDASFETSGWTMTIQDADGEPIPGDRVEVAERSFERIFVEVRAPDEVPEAHVESIVLTASTVGDREVSHSVVLDAAIHDHAVRILVEGAQAKDAFPGENVEYRLTLINEGNGDDQIRISFEGDEAPNPTWEASTSLEGDTTPLLEPGERLEDVIVHVHVPGPSERPVPVDGETTVIRATSLGQTPDGASPTDTVPVETNLVRYQPIDINDDGHLELAVDLNRDVSDG